MGPTSEIGESDETDKRGVAVTRLGVYGIVFFVMWRATPWFRTWWALALFGALVAFDAWLVFVGQKKVRDYLEREHPEKLEMDRGDARRSTLRHGALSMVLGAPIIGVAWIFKPSLAPNHVWLGLLGGSLLAGAIMFAVAKLQNNDR